MKCNSNREIIFIGNRLSMHRNRHTTTKGYSWGWIDGGAETNFWSNDPGSRFTEDQARAYVDRSNLGLVVAERLYLGANI